MDDRTPCDTEPLSELGPEVCFVEVAGGLGLQVQVPGVQRPPPAIHATRRVCNEDVGVEVRVTGPAGAMPEPGPDEPFTTYGHDAIPAPTRPARLLFEIGERSVDADLVGGPDFPACL